MPALTPSQYPNPLALDIEEDWHQHLLEKGNLGKKPRLTSWSDENSWTSLGYSARVLRTVCACGEKTDSLLGIFHEERTPSGKTRSLSLAPNAQWPLDQDYPVHVTESPVRLCAACLPYHGFIERF